MTLYDVLASLWRTAVPVLVGCVGAVLAHLYLHVDDAALAQALVAGFAIVYHGLFRLLEARVSPAFGWFLGLAKPPNYDKSETPVSPWGPPPAT